MPRCTLALLALLGCLAVPGTATAASRPDARAFTRATLAFDLARGKAVGRAERRGDARRRNAMACLETLRAAPAERREELFLLYFTWVAAGYFTEDEPIFARWVRALKRVSTTDPALRQARISLGRSLVAARAFYGQGRRFCTPVEEWARAGWAPAARPRPLRRLRVLDRKPVPKRGISDAARQLRSQGGQGGQLAASVLREGIDEPDELVVQRDDPIVMLLSDQG